MTKNPKVSIIIVNFNGKKWLKNCFDSISHLKYKNYEIICVDNNSSDDSIEYITQNYPQILLIKNDINSGFTGGNNLGFENSSGDYIWMLNNDTTVEPNSLGLMVDYMEKNLYIGSLQSKLILMNDPNKLDVCGAYWTDSTLLYHYGYYGDVGTPKYNIPIPFFSNKGASMMLRTSVLKIVGFLDNDFWCYYEETDLCNRIWLAGYECWYLPSAVVYHAGGGTSLSMPNDFIQFHNFKNKILSIVKNYSIFSLFYIVPTHICVIVSLSLFWLLKGKYKHSLSIFKAIWWNLTNLKKSITKRKIIQKFRVVNDRDIFKKTKKNPKLIYYKCLILDLKKFQKYEK